MRSKDTLERLFDFFVHMSTDTQNYELDAQTLAEKVGDPDFMQSCTMNKRPLLVLLERGFLQRTLEDEQPPKYLSFLAHMLLRPFDETGPELLVALCNQIALMSQIEMNRDQLIKEKVLFQLIELLRSDDDVLLLSVTKALVNLSSGNFTAKDSIVNEGGVRALIPHLLNKPHELTRAFCVLLKNCLTAHELRERIVNDGAITPLVRLLHKSEIKDAQRGDAVVAAAAAAVWNLVAYQPAKPMVLKERAVEALVTQLQESTSKDVWQKCAGCLMVLSANSDKVKQQAGGGAIVALANIVRKSEANKPTLKAALGALAVLTSDEKNLSKLREEAMPLEQFAKEKDDKIQMFVAQIQDRLDPAA